MPPETYAYRLCSDVRYQPIGDEGVVIRQGAGEVLVLNEVGIRVLALLDQGLTLPGILDRLAGEFDADLGGLAADLDAFLEELSAAGLIEETDRP